MATPLSTQSLYRKWRPQTFDSLKGQDAIRDTIYYALTHGQVSQAYLFCGPRGTGKTTTARLIAKVLNCLAETDPKPCNTCASCGSITDGANLDIFELDAASNRGIDEIRQLRDTVRFAPTQAKYKVFIIDEVHMLTREAFNALLKTLEEPPAHAIFILATTEAHKIPPTIISRCQRYDFRLATLDTLTDHLLAVAKQEGMNLSPEAARFVARLGEGSFRDSLSLLEQVRAANKKEYTLEVVEELFGYIPQEQMAECLSAILSGKTKEAHAAIDAALARGADLKAFCDQLLMLSQQALESVAVGSVADLPSSLGQTCQSVGLKAVLTWVEYLAEAANQMKQSPIPRLPLDIAIAKYGVVSGKLVAPVVPAPVAVSAPLVVAAPSPEPAKTIAYAVVTSEKPEVVENPTPVSMEPVAVHETVSVPVAVAMPHEIPAEDWAAMLQELKKDAPSLVTSLAHCRVLGLEGDVVKVAVRYKMHSEKINQPKNREKIESVLMHVLNVPLKIEAQVVKDLPIEEDSVDVSQVFEFEE